VPIDFQDDQGNTLLHVVSQNGSRRMVKLCLRRGAALDLQNLTGQTALHFAYGYGYAEVGDYLVQKGADDRYVCMYVTCITIIDTIIHHILHILHIHTYTHTTPIHLSYFIISVCAIRTGSLAMRV
jgi:hypothetical protein